MNKAHPLAPAAARNAVVPTSTPTGYIQRGSPPNGLILALQAGSDCWEWWFICGTTYREAWCLERPEGGALSQARLWMWIQQDGA